MQCIALGTSSGKVLLYSVAQAKVETVLTDDNNKNKVQTLDWHKKYGLFSCTGNNFVQEWDLQSSKVRDKYNINVSSTSKQGNKVSAIRIVPHSQVSVILNSYIDMVVYTIIQTVLTMYVKVYLCFEMDICFK